MHCITYSLNCADRSTISAESTTPTRMPVNDTASPLSTSRLTSAASLESTTFTRENVTGMTHNWQIATHISDIFLCAGMFKGGVLGDRTHHAVCKTSFKKIAHFEPNIFKKLSRDTPPCPDPSLVVGENPPHQWWHKSHTFAARPLLFESIPSNSNSCLHSCINISIYYHHVS